MWYVDEVLWNTLGLLGKLLSSVARRAMIAKRLEGYLSTCLSEK